MNVSTIIILYSKTSSTVMQNKWFMKNKETKKNENLHENLCFQYVFLITIKYLKIYRTLHNINHIQRIHTCWLHYEQSLKCSYIMLRCTLKLGLKFIIFFGTFYRVRHELKLFTNANFRYYYRMFVQIKNVCYCGRDFKKNEETTIQSYDMKSYSKCI